MKKIIVLGACLPIAAFSFLGLAKTATAADLKPVASTPTGILSLDNKFDFSGTFSIKAQTVDGTSTGAANGTVYIDFQPTTNAPPTPISGADAAACFGEIASSVVNPVCSAAVDAVNAGITTTGNFLYGFNTATGALSEFQGFGNTGLVKDYLTTTFTPDAGRAVNIPQFLKLDGAGLNGLPVGLGLNYFDVTKEFQLVATYDAGTNRTTLNTSFGGFYTGPATGPLAGTLSLTSTFDGQTVEQVFAQIFDPTQGITNKAYAASGTLAATPEPSSVAGLALVAVASGMFLGKGKKKDLN